MSKATGRVAGTGVNRVQPGKLLLSKWTAVKPVGRNRHFLVVSVIIPEPPATRIEFVEIEAVLAKKPRRIRWRELRDAAVWRQGWV